MSSLTVKQRPQSKVGWGHDAARFVTQWWEGNRKASLLLLACRFLRCLSQWNPWLGSRVGEAKNPGPAGTRSTARKRAQKGGQIHRIWPCNCSVFWKTFKVPDKRNGPKQTLDLLSCCLTR